MQPVCGYDLWLVIADNRGELKIPDQGQWG